MLCVDGHMTEKTEGERGVGERHLSKQKENLPMPGWRRTEEEEEEDGSSTAVRTSVKDWIR